MQSTRQLMQLMQDAATCARILDPSFKLERNLIDLIDAKAYWRHTATSTPIWLTAAQLVVQRQNCRPPQEDTFINVPTEECCAQIQAATCAAYSTWNKPPESQLQAHAIVIWQAACEVQAWQEKLHAYRQKPQEAIWRKEQLRLNLIEAGSAFLKAVNARFTRICSSWETQCHTLFIHTLIAYLPLNRDVCAHIQTCWMAIQPISRQICQTMTNATKPFVICTHIELDG